MIQAHVDTIVRALDKLGWWALCYSINRRDVDAVRNPAYEAVHELKRLASDFKTLRFDGLTPDSVYMQLCEECLRAAGTHEPDCSARPERKEDTRWNE